MNVIERWECSGCRKQVGRVHANGCVRRGLIDRDDEITVPFKYVQREQLQGAIEALWRIAAAELPPEHDDDQEYAVDVLQTLGVNLAAYRPEGSTALPLPRLEASDGDA